MSAEAVTVSLADLEAGTVSDATLEEAFGPTSLGILVVRDLPARFAALRSQVLQSASYLAALPPSSLDTLTLPDARYLVGWSHGKETLKPGVYDTLKGSFYVNCAFHKDPSLAAPPLPEGEEDFPEYTAPNAWPSESELPEFRGTLEQLCGLIIDVAGLVARACDRYAARNITGYEAGYVERVVKSSLTTKARLLHYFPPTAAAKQGGDGKQGEGSDDDDWCATHVDHGCLTGLTSALFIDEAGGLPQAKSPPEQLAVLPTSPDPKAGLYIRSRTGDTTKVGIPADCLAFQTGETLERITRGKFRAVPHFVRGPDGGNTGKGAGVARNTLAVFTQPNLGEVIDERGTTFAGFSREVVVRNT